MLMVPEVAVIDPRYGLDLATGANRLVDYNPLWPAAFDEEARRIAALGDLILGTAHIGSTAVPGLTAKPIIDIQVGVARIGGGLRLIEPMARLGYDYAGDQGIAEHHVFGRGEARTHLVHVVTFAGAQWDGTIRFRDRLRSDRAEREAYERLKRELAAAGLSRAEYTAGKAAFVERLSVRA